MGLTAEQVKKIISNVVGVPEDLLQETYSETKFNLTYKIFQCDVESDEYTVLINDKKDEVIQIVNSYVKYDKEEIALRLAKIPT